MPFPWLGIHHPWKHPHSFLHPLTFKGHLRPHFQQKAFTGHIEGSQAPHWTLGAASRDMLPLWPGLTKLAGYVPLSSQGLPFFCLAHSRYTDEG